MRSVMKHDFSKVPSAEIQRSSFNRSHGYKTTFDAGYLYPIFFDEALPGDTFNLKLNTFARMATPIFPVMDNMFCDVFFFAVPYRLVWDNWERFNGAQDDPSDSTDYLIPTMTSPATGSPPGYKSGSLHDYFGLPIGYADVTHSALWHRAYNLIWNQWFRDQNLQDSVYTTRGDGPDDPANYTLLRRGKRHDYFTSALPWPQKGPTVLLPLGNEAPVFGDILASSSPTSGMRIQFYDAGSNVLTNDKTLSSASSGGIFAYNSTPASLGQGSINIASKAPGVDTKIYADLTDATAATINELREAFQLQRLFERDARGGTRYTEIIRSHFGVVSDDARLQRPEYLGGGSTRINVNPVAQTAETATTPQGNLAAFATFSHHGQPGFVKSFTEHCLLIGLISVRADLNYQQGLNRMWSRSTRYDFYWPALSHLGEQEVLNKEIYCDGNDATNNAVFGYQERFAEYRYKPSLVTGQFRSEAPTPLDAWHLAQYFSSRPSLNAAFIEENPPVTRVIAVPTEPQFLLDCYFDLKTARPMPMYSVPGLVDHF